MVWLLEGDSQCLPLNKYHHRGMVSAVLQLYHLGGARWGGAREANLSLMSIETRD